MYSLSLIPAKGSKQKIVPSKVICIGRNYVDHIKELSNEIPDELVVFIKPNSAISEKLYAKHNGDCLHYEAELSFLYQQGKFTAVALGIDLTKREVQADLKAKGLPWERAKAFDSSAVFSDFVTFKQEQSEQLMLSLTINKTLAQQGGVKLMMVKPDDILTELQSFMTLEDGDVVMTGTPKGVGMISQNSSFSGEVFIAHNDNSLANKTLLTCQWQAQ
jgi:2-keto-4-pentenoate hydratase/2-oxohepta-3-ene-1,7-dioic acid hydratase in catechol pathway